MPGHYHSAPAGAFGKKRRFEPIADPHAQCIWAPFGAGTHALADAEHFLHERGVDYYTIKFVTPKVLSQIRDSYKFLPMNVVGPVDRLVDALARVNERM